MGILKHVPKQIGDRIPKVYFSCHKDDFKHYFKEISEEIMNGRSCAVFYDEDYEGARDKEFLFDLSKMNLFVMPITTRLLTKPNRALDEELAFALEHKIPVLPLMQESGLEELFNKKFGDLQFLDKYNIDSTAISYDEKLKKYLSSVLLDDKTIKRIRAEFDARIFLSYRKKDRIHANRLMRLIHKNDFCRDIAIWYDEFLTPGENFNKTIAEALNKSDLFVLAVTPSLLEPRVDENGVKHKNYIEEHEYPMAVEAQKTVLPTELVYTDKGVLAEKYTNIPDCVNANDESALTEALLNTAKKFVSDENDNSPEHNYLIGLAYLDGIDVERDYDKALEMLAFAAENEFPDATIKLISMYSDGIGVSRDENEVRKWSEKLSDYYFKNTFSNEGNIKSADKIEELFANYNDRYWAETIKRFLVSADKKLPLETIKELYKLLTSLGICEYTLLFDSCKEMEQHQEEAQSFLVGDILTKSSNGTYPPYGPLFWYVPEYELYEPALLALDGIKGEACFTKALALTRDVCWIFGHYNDVSEITKRVDGNELFASATLTGVRRGICELFYTGNTDETDGDSIYPRCFNLAEAKNWKEHGQGILGRMNAAFEDELGLYSHEMFSELDGEYIGIVSAPYDKERLETVLPQKSCKKLCGLFLSPTENEILEPLAINDKHLKMVYIPENVTDNGFSCSNFCMLNDTLMYFFNTVDIPYGVKEIDPFTFAYCTDLNQITIPDSIIEIGDGAFWGCTSLLKITIPSSVIKIGYGAFAECALLSKVTVPHGLTKIEREVFAGCAALKQITIPNDVTEIGWGSFIGCSSLSKIIIPHRVERIEWCAFDNCRALKEISIPDSVTKIGHHAFSHCTSLLKIAIPKGVTKIEDGVFDGCSALREVCISDNVTIIGSNAFKGCSALTEIAIPEGVTEIGWKAFEGCASLKKIVIPNNVTEIGRNVFKGCTSLTLIDNCPTKYNHLELGLSKDCQIRTRSSFENDNIVAMRDRKKEILKIPQGTKNINQKEYFGQHGLREIIIPDSVVEINEEAFAECILLEEVVLPNSVKKIGSGAFSKCRNLQKITMPDGVTTIGSDAFRVISDELNIAMPVNGAFQGCVALKKVILPNSVIKIGRYTFADCRSLETISIPNGVIEIGRGAFEGCISLTNITIPSGVTNIEDHTFENCTALAKIFISCKVASIGRYSFKNCKSLKNIYIPDTVTRIGAEAFEGCTSLENINIPDSVTKIESGAFIKCAALTEIVIPNSVEELGNVGFKDCAALSKIFLSNSMTTISPGVFSGCISISKITIPNSVTRIGNDAFLNCISLTKIEIPYGVTEIERNTFSGCTSLTDIVIPNNTTKICREAFSNCPSLANINIPNSVRFIGDNAFDGCTGLKAVTISRRFEDELPRIFSGVDLSKVTVKWI